MVMKIHEMEMRAEGEKTGMKNQIVADARAMYSGREAGCNVSRIKTARRWH